MGDSEPSSRSRHVSKTSQKSCDDSSSNSSSELSTLPMPTPPDGGWGWVIVASTFLVNLIADGFAFSFGILFMELHDYFQDSHSQISWIGSVFFAMPLLAGPIAGAFINKFGCRRTCIFGAIISAVGCVLSVFATSSVYLCMTFGVISGLGLSFVYTPAVVIVAFYFEKRRAFATGLSVSGSGIGTFAVAPLLEFLMKTYGWRGTFLLMGGFFLNMIVCGALFRPLETSDQRKLRKFMHSLDRLSRNPSRNNSMLNISANEDALNQIMRLNGRRCSAAVVKIKKSLCEPVTHSLIQLPTYCYKDDGITPKGSSSEAYVSGNLKVTFVTGREDTCGKTEEDAPSGVKLVHEEGVQNGNAVGICENVADCSVKWSKSLNDHVDENIATQDNHLVSLFKSNSQPLDRTNSLEEIQVLLHPKTNGEVISASLSEDPEQPRSLTLPKNVARQKQSNQDQYLPMYRRDIFYRGSLIHLDEFIQNKSSSCPHLYKASSELSSDDEADNNLFACCRLKHAKQVIKEMLDISIFRSVKYFLFFLSNFILYMWYDVPYFYLPDYGAQVGLTAEQGSMVIAVIGIANTIGQIFFGVIADHPKVNSSLCYGVSMVICGISNLTYPSCTNYVTICLNSVVFGFFIGANYSLCSIIIVEVLSLDKLTNAYGIMMCGQGVANLVGPPFAGFFYDLTGSYLTTFYCAGAFIILSGFLLFAVALIQLRKKSTQDLDVLSDEQEALECN